METQNKPMENVFVYVKSIYEKTGCRSMTSGEVYNLITGGALRQQTEHIRQLQAGENKKEEVDAAKRKLGGILSHAVFSGGRVGQNAESHTGCLMFDIDHCKTPARDVVRRASQLPYVLLATVSVRGEGVHVIVRADVCLANHSEVYKHVAKIITAALGEEIDPACKDLSRVMFLSHDAEAYYNPNASILEKQQFRQPHLDNRHRPLSRRRLNHHDERQPPHAADIPCRLPGECRFRHGRCD